MHLEIAEKISDEEKNRHKLDQFLQILSYLFLPNPVTNRNWMFNQRIFMKISQFQNAIHI